MGKDELSLSFGAARPAAKPERRPLRAGSILTALLLLVSLFYWRASFPSLARHCAGGNWRHYDSIPAAEDWCPLPDSIAARDDGLKPSDHLMSTSQRNLQAKRLSAAVRVPTESYDDNGDVAEDPRWAIFDKLHGVLEELFPLVHSQLKLQKVNRYGLLYTFKGSDPALKPILFMAHQDVVPADASSNWTYPPYSGHYDGSFVWGRGASDCKNVLIGVLSTIEDLLSQSFAPRRTIVLSFGFDEETGGLQGATALNKALVEEWGHDSILLAMDEGGMGLTLVGDILYAYPGVGEKGYYDVELSLEVQGGHSSKPPPHTGIGIMAEVIRQLESEPYQPRLTQSSPFRRVLECRAKFSPKEVQPWLRDALLHADEEEIARKLISEIGDNGDEKWLMQTSQAVDVISGGIKVNALPETVRLMVNHRVIMHESTDFVNKHIYDTLVPVAKRYNLDIRSLDASGDEEAADPTLTSSGGRLGLKPMQVLPPAPLSPTSNSSVWEIFSGTLRHVFEDTDTGRGKTVVPVGNIMTGNTDTTHYWDVTKNIYRYSPTRDGTRYNAHAIDERMEITGHLEGMRVYYDLIRNFDSWTEE